MFSIEEFKANFNGGARLNKFEIEIPGLPDKARFLLKAGNLPGANIGEVIYNYQGVQIKLAGDKTFNNWEVTMILDTDYAGFNEVEAWHNLIKNNENGEGATNHNQYKKEAFITHFDHDGTVISRYKVFGIWPSVIPDTALGWDSVDSPAEIPITFTIDYRERDA